MRKRRFFFHFNKWTGKMTLHYKKECILVDDVICQVPCETKWNKFQPKLVMRGFSNNIEIVNKKAYIR